MNYSNLIVSVLLLIIVQKAESRWQQNDDTVPYFLKDDEILTSTIKCLTDEIVCSLSGVMVKSYLMGIMQTTCANCTEDEKKTVRSGMNFMLAKRPSDFHKIFRKLDPNNKYKPRMMEFLNKSS